MSIEQKIEALTAAVEALTAAVVSAAKAPVVVNTVATVNAENADAPPAGQTAAQRKAADKAKTKELADKVNKEAAENAARAKAEQKAREEADDGLGGEETDDDGLGGGDPEREYTIPQMKEVLFALKDKTGDKAAPLAVLARFGYTGVPSVQEKDASAIGRAAQIELDAL